MVEFVLSVLKDLTLFGLITYLYVKIVVLEETVRKLVESRD